MGQKEQTRSVSKWTADQRSDREDLSIGQAACNGHPNLNQRQACGRILALALHAGFGNNRAAGGQKTNLCPEERGRHVESLLHIRNADGCQPA